MKLAFAIVDVDGYTRRGWSKIPCTEKKDGFRPRECAFAFYYDGYIWGRPDYFYDDPKTLNVLNTEEDGLWYTYEYLTGLPINPAASKGMHFSHSLLNVFRHRIREFQSYLEADTILTVMAKGGEELKWISALRIPNIRCLELEDCGCPMVEQLAVLKNDFLNCGKHRTVKQRFISVRHLTRQALHCPLLEVGLFMDWWVNIGFARPLLANLKLPALVEEYLYGTVPEMKRDKAKKKRKN